jgi:hypothetical protein
MKNLVIQYYIDINLYDNPKFNGITSNTVEKYSEHSFRKYCSKFGHDYLRVTKPVFHYTHPTWERFDLWFNSEWLDKYDQVLYVDTDVFALDHAPDIFAKYNNLTTFKSPAYGKYRKNTPATIKSKFKDTILHDCNPTKVSDTFFQTGVWMLTREARDKMMPWVNRYMEFDGQCDDGQFLNWAVIQSDVGYQDMDPMFNVKNNGLKKNWKYKDTFFLHSAGGDKYKENSKIHNFLKETFPEVNLND